MITAMAPPGINPPNTMRKAASAPPAAPGVGTKIIATKIIHCSRNILNKSTSSPKARINTGRILSRQIHWTTRQEKLRKKCPFPFFEISRIRSVSSFFVRTNLTNNRRKNLGVIFQSNFLCCKILPNTISKMILRGGPIHCL